MTYPNLGGNELRRPFELIVSIGADSLEEIRYALHSIEHRILESEYKEGNENFISSSVTSGGSGSSFCLSIIRTETKDHDEYFKQVDEYLKKKN